MQRAALFLSIAATPSVVMAQLSHTPLPPVPRSQPLYAPAPHTRPVIVRAEAPARVAPFQVPMVVRAAVPLPAPAPAPVSAPKVELAHVPAPLIVTPPVIALAVPEPARPIAMAAAEFLLPPNTDVLVRLDEEVSSKAKRVGDAFRMTVVQDVMHQGAVVIPRGTPVLGSVAWRTGKGMFGKSAKMEITVDQLTLNGKTVKLFGRFREEGEGNTGATIGTAVAAGVIAAAFITGRSAVFPAGREFRVSTREAFAFAPAAAPALVAAAGAAPE